MSDVPKPVNDVTIQHQRVIAFFGTKWPPNDARTLYSWGRSELQHLGKEVCVRAVLASYEEEGYRLNETPYDRSARRAAERWVLDPNEDTRKLAGRVASMQTPTSSPARMIANMAGSKRRWPTAVGFGLTWRAPVEVSSDRLRAICDAIQREVLAWARGECDPVAQRHGEETQDASEPST